MKKSKAIIVAVASIALILAGCSSGGEEPGGSGQTEPGDSGQNGSDEDGGWSIPDEDPTATIQVLGHIPAEDLAPVIAAFEDDHPSITVEYEGVPFDQLNSILDARMANQDGNPDVYFADQPRIPALSARGFTEDLSAAFDEHSSIWDPAATEASSFGGSLWAVPLANSAQLLYYNKDLLDAAGIEAPGPAIDDRLTWEELKDLAQQASDAGAKNGMLFGQVNRYYQLQPLPMSLGGSAGGTGEENLEPDIQGDEWVEALTWYQSVFQDGLSDVSVGGEQSNTEFLGGSTAFIVQGTWLLGDMERATFEWGVAPHPYFDGGDIVTPTGSWSMAMSPFSDDKDAAAIFLKWMSIDDGGQYTQNMVAPDLPATVESRDIFFQRPLFDSESATAAIPIIEHETTTTGVPRLQTVGYVEFEEIIGRAFADVASGTDPASALASATSELETAWAIYK